MASVPRSEDAGVAINALWHIIEPIRDAVPNVVNRPPNHLFNVERIRADDAIGGRQHIRLGQLALRCPLAHVKLIELNIDAENIAPLPRQEQQIALAG